MPNKENKLIFQVEYKTNFGMDGIEPEYSWFLVDQQGKFYCHGPMKPITPCGPEYTELIPLIKINGKFMSIEEIEKAIKKH